MKPLTVRPGTFEKVIMVNFDVFLRMMIYGDMSSNISSH